VTTQKDRTQTCSEVRFYRIVMWVFVPHDMACFEGTGAGTQVTAKIVGKVLFAAAEDVNLDRQSQPRGDD
jgi:hypothetical protein